MSVGSGLVTAGQLQRLQSLWLPGGWDEQRGLVLCPSLRAFCRLFGALGLDRRDVEQNLEYLMSSSRSAESPGFGRSPSQTYCCFEVERCVRVYTLL